MRTLYLHSAVGMAVCDLAGRYVSVNAALCGFLGYTSEELLARTYMDVTHPDDTARNVELRAALIDNRDETFQVEKRYVHKSGTIVWALTVVSVVRDATGRPLYTIGQMLDISLLKQTEQTVLDYRNQIQKLAAHDNLLIEAERKRIAHEIHDEIGQLLTVLKIDMQLCRAAIPGDAPLHRRTEDMLELIEQTIASVRNITHNLRPPALNLGLAAALEWLVQDVSRRTALHIVLNCDYSGRVIDDDTATAAFRVVQESITNIIRHARATNVLITLACREENLQLDIVDDGCGFDVDAAFRRGGFGLLGMRERIAALGGRLDIESDVDAGTTVRIVLAVKR